MYHSYVSVKPASTTLSYSFFLWKYVCLNTDGFSMEVYGV